MTKKDAKLIAEALRTFYTGCIPFQRPLIKSIIVSICYCLFKDDTKKQDLFKKDCGIIE